jgi:hypothetical protein
MITKSNDIFVNINSCRSRVKNLKISFFVSGGQLIVERKELRAFKSNRFALHFANKKFLGRKQLNIESAFSVALSLVYAQMVLKSMFIGDQELGKH